MIEPTPYPEINGLLDELLRGVKNILGNHFIGMYLDGSLALGDFDQDSDVDFVVVSDLDVTGVLFSELQAFHQRIARFDSEFAIQLEGYYVSQDTLRRYDPSAPACPNLERGQGEQLKMIPPHPSWLIHQSVLRNHGIPLAGPSLQALIDPVTPDQLKRAMLSILEYWAAPIITEPSRIGSRGYQSYVVLSLCRILYTLEFGTVVSKRTAARWAQETLGAPWASLIERSWEGRHHGGFDADQTEVDKTLEFIRFTIERSRQSELPATT